MKPALLLILAAAPAAAQDDIAAQRSQLAALTARVDAAAGRPFVTSRRLHVDLDSRVFTVWLGAVAPNGVRSTATGTAVQGDVVRIERPVVGVIRARIDPPSATRVDLTLTNPRISAANNRLTVNGNLRGEVRAQVRVTGVGRSETVACTTTPAIRERGTATFELGTSRGTRYPYTLRLSTPNNLVASLTCDIGDLRRIEDVLPINSLAGDLGSGTIDIGLSSDIRLPTPGAGRPMTIPLAPRRPSCRRLLQSAL